MLLEGQFLVHVTFHVWGLIIFPCISLVLLVLPLLYLVNVLTTESTYYLPLGL